MAALVLPGLPAAQAVPVGGGWERAAGLEGARHFVGQHVNSDGLIAYCTDFERLSPPHADGYHKGNTGTFSRSDGTRLSAPENAALSYLLHRWGSTGNHAQAAAVQLAVWEMTSPGMRWDSEGMKEVLRTERLPASVVEQARSMTRTALTEAGPYDVRVELGKPGSDGTISATVRIAGANGTLAAGLAASAEISGPFTFAEESAAMWTSGGEVHQLTLKRTGLGGGSLTVSVPRTPAAGVNWLVPKRGDVQRLLTAAVVEPRDAATAIADLPVFQPAVETRTSASRTAPGTTIHDVLTVRAATAAGAGSSESPVPWMSVPSSQTPVSVEVVSTLWGPLDAPPVPGDTVPPGIPALGSVITRVDGPGIYATPGLVVPSSGWYVWTETIAPESALPAEAAAYVSGWQGRYGIAAETTFVPWTPQVRTNLSQHEALVGESVTDHAAIEGFGARPGNSTGSVLLSMYGPLAAAPALTATVPAGTPLHSETTVPAVNGNFTSPHFAPFREPGCYTVVASYPGDEYTEPFTSPFGEPSETVCVEEVPSAVPGQPAAAAPGPLAASDPVPTPDQNLVPVTASAPQHGRLPQTGVRTEVAAGAALALIGAGLACVQLGATRRRA